jgi:hypothetical protein
MRQISFRLGWLAVAALLLMVAPSTAQQICLQLESQLAAIDRSGNQQQYQQLQAQYQSARAAYDTAYYRVQQAGCAVVFRLFAPPQCQAMLQNLDRMSADLAQLEAAMRNADPNQTASVRNNLLQALAANNCGPQYAPYAVRQPQGLLDRLFGPPINGPFGNVPLVSTYRTLCVRSCDGYYFPISFSTTPGQFEADAATCQAQCPGGDAALYIHLNPGETMEEAVDLDGRPYAALPTAFAFRESYNPTCGCQPVTTVATVEGPPYTPIEVSLEARLAALRTIIPTPARRPEPTEDPETLANRAGGFIPGQPMSNVPALVAGGVTGDGGIRLIGPAYYYAQ